MIFEQEKRSTSKTLAGNQVFISGRVKARLHISSLLSL